MRKKSVKKQRKIGKITHPGKISLTKNSMSTRSTSALIYLRKWKIFTRWLMI
jgi:hypothetical protein